MANLPISGLPAAGALTGAEITALVQGGVTSRSTLALQQALYGHPGYVSATFYTLLHTIISNGAITANLNYAHPIFIGAAVTLSQLGFNCSAGVAASQALLGIYTNLAGRPDTLLTQLSAAVSTAVGGVDVTGSFAANPTLQPGWYWFASLFSAAPSVASIHPSDQIVQGLVGGATIRGSAGTSSTSNNVTGVTGVATFAGGFPASFGAATKVETLVPAVSMKVA